MEYRSNKLSKHAAEGDDVGLSHLLRPMAVLASSKSCWGVKGWSESEEVTSHFRDLCTIEPNQSTTREAVELRATRTKSTAVGGQRRAAMKMVTAASAAKR